MGAHGSRGRAAQGRRGAHLTTGDDERARARVCRVQPDVPAIARAFDYLVPAGLASGVEVGAIVRVALHGRRVRGWVVADDVEPETDRERLVPLLAVASAGPPAAVVDLCRWVAWRWAGPVSTVLRAASPPNVVPAGAAPEVEVGVYARAADPPVALPDESMGDRRVRSIVWAPAADLAELVPALAAAEGSTIVVVPEPAHAAPLARAFAREGREVVELHAGIPDAARTAAWGQARGGARVVVGGRTAVFAPVPDLAAIVVVDDGDEALQEERTPTWHARDVAVERARREGALLSIVSPVPTLEAYHLTGCRAPLAPATTRTRAGWSRLDVVDLRDEAPGTGLLSERLAAALHRAVDGGGRAVCVVNRRGRARLLACRTCQALARCAVCDAAVVQPERELVCPRCAATRPPVCLECHGSAFRTVRPGIAKLRDDVAGLVPRLAVAEVDARTETVPDAPVVVGTEAALHRVGGDVRLVAFLEFDQELLAPRARAAEQALWLLARASRLAGGRRGIAPGGLMPADVVPARVVPARAVPARAVPDRIVPDRIVPDGIVMVQTRMPGHEVLRAAATGDPAALLEREAERRRALGFPPFGGLAELSGDPGAVDAATATLRAAGIDGLRVLGPAANGHTLLLAPSADALAGALAAVDLAGARTAGRLRVAVDPPRV